MDSLARSLITGESYADNFRRTFYKEKAPTPSIALRGVLAHCTVGDAFTEHGVIGKIFAAKK